MTMTLILITMKIMILTISDYDCDNDNDDNNTHEASVYQADKPTPQAGQAKPVIPPDNIGSSSPKQYVTWYPYISCLP